MAIDCQVADGDRSCARRISILATDIVRLRDWPVSRKTIGIFVLVNVSELSLSLVALTVGGQTEITQEAAA